MGKMVYLMGKSSSGKDTVYRRMLEWNFPALKKIVPYTTRPIRAGEAQGEEYYFTDDAGYREMEAQGRVIEARAYHTYHGLWRYFTVDDGRIDLGQNNYLIIGTIESYLKTAQYFGTKKILPVLLELDDGIRLKRALEREMHQEKPRYQEMCRRFLADEEDFSEEKIKEAGIARRFSNHNLNDCLKEIKEYIISSLREEA
ncbi:MAG: guanylate kinase [Lachnospiraceae bacterium]|nr:guanylate kinase [Lachnospiraceae bacterium]